MPSIRYWYHPHVCCGPPDSVPSTLYAMCPSGDSVLGHNHYVDYGEPYGNGGSPDEDDPNWVWRHPYTCSPSNANACVFTKEPIGPIGYTNKGQSRIIMNSSGTLTTTYGQRYNDWWYHRPWLFCKDSDTDGEDPDPLVEDPDPMVRSHLLVSSFSNLNTLSISI